jgi:ribonuclease G
VDEEPGERRRGSRLNGGRTPRAPLPSIQDILQKGQELLVQVTKEPIANKGPRITTQISLPGRFAVIMPNVEHVGVSRKIEDRVERQRLKDLVTQLKPEGCALIVRTVGEGAESKALETDVTHLVSLWKEIQTKATTASAPSLVHQDVGLVIGLVRDVFNDDVDQLILDDRDAHDELTRYLRSFAPELRERVKLYTDPMPIFDKYGVESEIDKTLDRKVWLKKGGYILIEQTEALVAIDVNTGRFIGKKNQEETIFKTNMLAAREIARQLRLRDIGGIIVIDFIDMESEANKKKVLAELRQYLKRDRAKTKAFQVSDLGLIEMSRQRVRPSLYHFMSDKCAYCESTGHVLSLDSIANRIERMVRRVSHYTRTRDLRLQANPRLTVFLREERQDRLNELAKATGVSMDLVDDARLHREEFRLVAVPSGEDLMRRVSSPGGNGAGASVRADDGETRRRTARPVRTLSGGRPNRPPREAPRDRAREAGGANLERGRGRDRDRDRERPDRGRDRERSRERGEPIAEAPRGLRGERPVGAPSAPELGNGRSGPGRRRRGSRGRGRRGSGGSGSGGAGGGSGRPVLEDGPGEAPGPSYVAPVIENPTPES